jgi:hypothetical protein
MRVAQKPPVLPYFWLARHLLQFRRGNSGFGDRKDPL